MKRITSSWNLAFNVVAMTWCFLGQMDVFIFKVELITLSNRLKFGAWLLQLGAWYAIVIYKKHYL